MHRELSPVSRTTFTNINAMYLFLFRDGVVKSLNTSSTLIFSENDDSKQEQKNVGQIALLNTGVSPEFHKPVPPWSHSSLNDRLAKQYTCIG